MTHRKPLYLLLVFSLLVSSSLACQFLSNVGQPATPATDTALPSETPAPPTETPIPPTETPVPLSQQVMLTAEHYEEAGQDPNYTITSDTPVLTGSDDPRVQAFNTLAGDMVNRDVNEFKASLKYMTTPALTSGSFIQIDFEKVSPEGELLSLKVHGIGYSDGAAHPYHYTQTINFDLTRGEEIQMDSLFLPGSNYLEQIAEYCKSELSTRDIAFDAFATGADPTPENYRNWNITADGLLITFDEYQVAAYAAGPQTVLIPYNKLSAIIDPQGPLGRFIR